MVVWRRRVALGKLGNWFDWLGLGATTPDFWMGLTDEQDEMPIKTPRSLILKILSSRQNWFDLVRLSATDRTEKTFRQDKQDKNRWDPALFNPVNPVHPVKNWFDLV
jgi:hypothetical protein